ncbi:MAG: aminotransferase class I/II-fold pyridoxal phosphate-dependent enzyme, partial [Deltaproteobacteria bacterium]|nr:aminotransferase class I/II-fold pyridoxal phosphate-dependent enzyme [Deltaproteobacteria bacterium]
MNKKRSIFFMDGSTLKYTQDYLDIQIQQPILMPVPCDDVAVNMKKGRLKKERDYISFCWVGRIADFKTPILIYTIRRLSNFARQKKTLMKFHIIGEGPDESKLRAMNEGHAYFQIFYEGVVAGEALDLFLLDNVDVLTAMGTSALEGAKLGVPTILLDASYGPVTRDYKFRWLFESKDFILGEHMSESNFAAHNGSLERMMEEIIEDYSLLSTKTFDYCARNHSISSVCKKFISAIEVASFRYGDFSPRIMQKNLIRRVYERVKNNKKGGIIMLPVSRPSIGQEELKEIEKVFSTGWLGLGSTVFEFENKLKNYLEAKNVLAVNTGTTALHIALDAFGIKDDDEVIVPSLTFCSSVQAITAVRARPVFCEINPETLNVDVADIKRRITKKTKAIMPVHYCGQACDMDALMEIGKTYSIAIIEDAAHAFGSTYKGKKIGSFGDATCFSFDPIKNLTCGEGGAVVLSDDTIAESIRTKRILGIDKDTWHRYRNERAWFYEVITQGYRYHMSNINAAIGIAQFEKFELFIHRKHEIVQKYNDAFMHID